MLYTFLRIILLPDIAYEVRDGRIVRHHGGNSRRYVEDVEAVCRIHGAPDGMLFGRWTGDRYKLTAIGDLKKAIVPLSNCIC